MKTNCETYFNHLPAYVEGHLPSETRMALLRHLESCAACREELACYQTLTRQLEATGVALRRAVPVPADLDAGRHVSALSDSAPEHVVDAADDVLDTALYALGDRLRQGMPAIDVHEAVMAGVAREMAEPIADERAEEALEEQLYALGAVMRHGAPRVDLHAPIMTAVLLEAAREKADARHEQDANTAEAQEATQRKQAAHHTDTVVDLSEYRQQQAHKLQRKQRPLLANLAYWGLAACVLVMLGIAAHQVVFDTDFAPGSQMAGGPESQEPAMEAGSGALPGEGEAEMGIQGRLDEMGAMQQILNNLMDDPPAPDSQGRPTRQAMESITLKDALDARSKAGRQDSDAINTLQQWAGLTSAEAQDLMEAGALDAEALIGAGLFLTPEEAVAMLQDAVNNDPENPFLRYALAKNLGLAEESLEGTLQQLEAWAQMDPENALPHYYGALEHFSGGNAHAAIGALQAAGDMEQASGYALDAARYTEQLLVASGMNPETARFLSATTAGSGQYADLTSLSRELLEYGAYYESIGDYETAREIYESVNRMGAQVADGAQVANERLAGLDIQHQSINAFEGLHDILVDPVSLQVLEQTFNTFVQALNDFSQYMAAYNDLLALADVDLASMIADIILQQGDLDIFNHLQ